MPSFSRRRFLQSTAAAIAAASQGPLLFGSETSNGMTPEGLPTIPYGAVYFRKSNPPKEDWEQDYQQAAADGMNCFRHWFLWSAIEVAPGKYDWDDYDRQMDLAAKYGLKTIVADILCTAPQWAFKDYPHAWIEEADGTHRASHYTVACSVGGWPGLCLDNEEVRAHAEAFLRALVTRYRDHPAMGGYDVWNELNHFGDAGGCFCEASAVQFRQWLAKKYGTIDALNEAWYRYSYRDWSDVDPPPTNDPYPDSIDWIQFRIDNAVRLFEWRVGVIRELDSKNPVTAHCIPMGAMRKVGPATYPVFQVGRLVDVYGYSGGCNHEEWSKLRWQHWCKMDMTRSASQGKPFWAAEMPAGASWRMWGERDLDEGRICTASDVELYSLMQLAGGARGVFSPRWRPLLDGWHVGNFGFYEMDGSATERSEAAEEIARWANQPELADLWAAKPVQGDIGILVVPESQIHCCATHDETDFYYRAISGAYRGFLFNNIQPDFVPIDAIDSGPEVLYLPYPVMLSRQTAETLKRWVARGGRLICEGLPAYFGDRGRAGESQPNYGLGELFGAKQQDVQFTPDLLDKLEVTMDTGHSVGGGVYLQSYLPTTGKPVGRFEDGRIAVVDNTFGQGRTRLIGTFPGYGYAEHQDDATMRFFADALRWAGKPPHVTCSDNRVIARLQASEKAIYLWLVNSLREPVDTELILAPTCGPIHYVEPVRGRAAQRRDRGGAAVTVPARDVWIARLI